MNLPRIVDRLDGPADRQVAGCDVQQLHVYPFRIGQING